jgi:hypothetical protein
MPETIQHKILKKMVFNKPMFSIKHTISEGRRKREFYDYEHFETKEAAQAALPKIIADFEDFWRKEQKFPGRA